MEEPILKNVYKSVWLGPWEQVKKVLADGDGNSSMAILNVAMDINEYPHQQDILYIHAGLNDGTSDRKRPYGQDNPIEAYVNAIYSLEYLVDIGKFPYVHCHGGVSRGPFVVICYMAMDKGIGYFDAKELLRKRYIKADPHPKHELPHILNGISKMIGIKLLD